MKMKMEQKTCFKNMFHGVQKIKNKIACVLQHIHPKPQEKIQAKHLTYKYKSSKQILEK
jgi:hypothetical protein